MSKGPVAGYIDASDELSEYESGVFNGVCSEAINHAIVVVGYGDVSGKVYWIVRNSWGSDWGEKGYIRIADSASNRACGLKEEIEVYTSV